MADFTSLNGYNVRDAQAEALLIDNAGKNLLNIINTSKTVNGITFTVNDDKSITMVGTATGVSYFNLDFIVGLDTAVSICPTGNLVVTFGDSAFGIKMGLTSFKTDGSLLFVQVITKTTTFSYPTEAYKMRTYIQVDEGTVVNTTIYPMICRAEITDLTYEPYYRTNKQLDTDLSTVESNITEIKDYIGYTDNDIYGLEVDYENGIFTRLAGSIGKTGGADFDNTNTWGGRRRCNLTDNGVVTAYYGDEAYTETGALIQAVTVNGTEYLVGTSVQVMVEQPKFYYKVVPLKLESYTTQNGDIGYHIRKAAYYIADTPKDGFKLHPAFIRNGAEKEKIYLSAYEGCLYDTSASAYITDDAQVADFNTDKMSSIANVKPMSGLTQNLIRTNARKLAQNRGAGWEQMYIHTASATQLLFMVEYGTLNSQTAIGSGFVNKRDDGSTNMAENTGGTTSLGNASGSVFNNEVSYRGEENFWGNIWKWGDGINIQNPAPFNNSEYGNIYVADNGFADNTNTLPYEDTDIYPCKTDGGWISAFGYNEKFDWLFIPTEVTGDSSLPVGDMSWNGNIGWRAAILGGIWSNSSQAGAFCLYLNGASAYHSRDIGGRLVYIPDANESNRNLKQLDKDLSEVEDYVDSIQDVFTTTGITTNGNISITTGNYGTINCKGEKINIQAGRSTGVTSADHEQLNLSCQGNPIYGARNPAINLTQESLSIKGGTISGVASSVAIYGNNASGINNTGNIYLYTTSGGTGAQGNINLIAFGGDIKLQLENMSSAISLKEYVQGVVNGTY